MPTQSTAFSLPLKPGVYEEVRKHHDAIVQGLTQQDHEGHMRGRGFTAVKIFHQSQPHEALIFYFEGPDLEYALTHQAHREHEATQAWVAFLNQVTATVPESRNFRTLPAETLLDWHHEAGHRVASGRAADA